MPKAQDAARLKQETKNQKLYIAGHNGLVGSALAREAACRGYNNIVVRTRNELDLTDSFVVDKFFAEQKPEWVFLAAGRVGGIHANITYPVEFLLENLKIQNNIIESAYKHGVKKLLFLGSSCIYPKNAPQPIKEEYLLSSELEPTNEPYALAKIAGLKLCAAYHKEYGADFFAVMPSNLYGLNDNYHLENAHALPMLLRRIHECKEASDKSVTIWGSGKPKREFMYADDLADGCFFVMENHSADTIGEFINIGTGEEVTILELVSAICEVVGFEGEIVHDTSKPDGTMLKRMDVSKIHSLGWKHNTTLLDGIRLTYKDFIKNSNLRK
jgi:GDP-L-fucose synthase